LNIPAEQLSEIQEMMNNSDISPYRKKHLLKDKTGHGNCLSCGRLSDLQILYDVGDKETPLKRVQHYCSQCWEITLEREKQEPKDRSREKLAEYYGVAVALENYFGGGKDEYR
jgi:hypothetical protein